MYFIVFFFSTFTLFASSLSAEQLNVRPQDLSEAEIAIIELPPPTDSKPRSQSSQVSPTINKQESRTSILFKTKNDENLDHRESEDSQSKPFTITFPISKGLNNRQSVQSIVIPLPTSLDDKTGIIVIEDHSDGGLLDQRTLSAQFFSPSRLSSFKSQPLRLENGRNQSEITNIQLVSFNKTSKSSQKPILRSRNISKEIAVPSTISTVFFDDELAPTSTFSPETVFRPKVSTHQKKKFPEVVGRKKIASGDTVIINLRPKQSFNKKPTTSTTTTTTTTVLPTTDFLELEKTTETQTDLTTETLPEVTTLATTTPEATKSTTTRRRANIRLRNSINGRPSVRRSSFQASSSTARPTTTSMATSTVNVAEIDYDTTSPEIAFNSDRANNSNQSSEVATQASLPRRANKPRPPGIPRIPGNFGFLPSGKAFNIPQNVPGMAGEDYPIYAKIPVTNFDCRDQVYPGFYSDMEAGCQVYHSCNGKLRTSKHSFLCPNGTIFSQEYLICDWWYNVKCEDSPNYYPLNKEAFSAEPKKIKINVTNVNDKRNKHTTTEFVIRTITTTDLP